MQIDVISDTVCPWCFIGKRRLMRAMAMRPNIVFDVKWRPYRLDPTVPKGGAPNLPKMRTQSKTTFSRVATVVTARTTFVRPRPAKYVEKATIRTTGKVPRSMIRP